MPANYCKIALSTYKSRCEERQRTIVSKDEGHEYQHIGHNDKQGRVRHYKIDGEVLPKGKTPDRCDFMLLTDDTNPPTAYLIELKGSLADADKCIKQVESTEKMFGDELKGYKILYRFVFGKGHGFYSSGFIKWRDKLPKGKLVSKRNKIDDHF